MKKDRDPFMIGVSTEIESLRADIMGPEVQVEAGGVPRDDRGVLAFKGIPCAAPLVGDRRWHASTPSTRAAPSILCSSASR
jgi:para-nitrobenzyl esterase